MRRKELKDAMKDIFEDLFLPLWAKVECIIEDLEKVNLEQFIGICCYCYRIVSIHHQLDGICTNAPSQEDLHRLLFLEICDFNNFRFRFENIHLTDSLSDVFNQIRLK